MNENELVLKSINDLLSEQFYVPAYQRGYRWTPTQVKALLDDIWKFRADSQNGPTEAFYCLQPVVVAQSDKGWIVIDGQQRLTTIHIITSFLRDVMQMLGKQKFSIGYETRTGSGAFLNDLDLTKSEENIDYFHMCQAYNTIEEWFGQQDGTAKVHFLTTLLNTDQQGKNVKVIWYEIGETGTDNHIDIFTRLNIGKIPLTNAELVKALFLKKGNFSEDKASLKQIQIASEWDNIEKRLQDDAFWLFIYDPENSLTYSSRIEYIFDLMKEKTSEDEVYHTFNLFYEDFISSTERDGKPDIEGLWMEVKKYFLTFEEWYNNRVLYHYIGFLIDCGHSVNELKEAASRVSKTAFKADLESKIGSEVNCDVDDLDYGNKRDKEYIKKVLLLFNLQSILATQTADIRFPFHRYKGVPWDIEHVRSQTDKNIAGNARKDWLIDVLEYFTGVKGYASSTQKEQQQESINALDRTEQRFCNRITPLLDAEEIDESSFENIYNGIRTHFKEDTQPDNIHSLSNLALLDPKTNRSYKNAMFPIKRNIILANDMKGVFVPLCTKNVFLKSYSKKMGEIMYWKNEDAEGYLKAIKTTLANFLPQNDTHDRA